VRAVLAFSELVGDGPAGADAGPAQLSVRMESDAGVVVLERTSLASEQWSPRWSFMHLLDDGDRGHWSLWLRHASDRAENRLDERKLGEVDVDT